MNTGTHQTTIPSEAEMFAAVRARDPRYDRVFLYGVVTTGVFCLPSCPARPARPENMRFYLDAAAADRAGMRPCQRCRPLEADEEAERLIELARYLQNEPDGNPTVKAMAERVAMSPARLQKTFRTRFGVTPAEFRDAVRHDRFKTALANGRSVAEATYEAGYGSTSRVYDVNARSIGMSPRSYRAGAPGERIFFALRDTSLGPLLMAATAAGVCFAQFGEYGDSLMEALAAEFPKATLTPSTAADSPALDQWMAGLEAHLTERAPRPDVPLDLRGTAFQISVWRYLLSVPSGDVISYGELAGGIGSPRAVRAAASACAANRIAVLVPCHRVLRGDGSLGGYRWGLERKRALIETERAAASRSETPA
jgi:AraC family transcriptional regulator of adaptative response/methylated-DNA-[protein]-cysteine methyltransferase